MELKPLSFHIVAIGEILWDVFPDGEKFGGAPANFACSVSELTGTHSWTTLVSAVVNDKFGEDAIKSLQQRGVDTRFIQRTNYPTGRVDVLVDDAGIASYKFAANSAWDHLSWNPRLEKLAKECNAVCFGSLGQRSEVSRATIRRFVNSTPAGSLRIFDVNIRDPFISNECILSSLTLANTLKLNEDELPVIASLCGLHGKPKEILRELAKQFDLQFIALTLGDKGSILLSGDEIDECSALSGDVVDTVGAGDAFTASLVVSMLTEQPLTIMNLRANRVASYVCSQAGATMEFPNSLQNNPT